MTAWAPDPWPPRPASPGSGPVAVDLSTWTVETDPDGIIQSITGSKITLVKSGGGHLAANWARLVSTVELQVGKAYLLSMKRTGVTSSDKAVLAFGAYDTASAELYMAGLNAVGTGVSQALTIVGVNNTWLTAGTTEDTLKLVLKVDADGMLRYNQVDVLKPDGKWFQSSAFGSGGVVGPAITMKLAVIIALNDAAGGTLNFDYELSYQEVSF